MASCLHVDGIPVTLLSKVVRMAEWAARKRALRVASYTQADGSHLIDITMRDGSRKEMHAPAGKLEVDWEPTPEILAWQKRLGER